MDLQKARDGSLLAKYVAGSMILVGTVAIGLGLLPGLTVQALLLAALGLVAVFGTVDLNLLADKIFGSLRKEGGP